ncbi:GSCOCG00004322001-RA-CDS, partial [Cotesia congregata]
MNATWGLIKRAGRATLSKRLHLYNSLANSGALYGVEVWGWPFNEDYNRLYARAHKMALGDYWKDKTGESWTKEVWARLRCGSVERCFKKGFKDWTCRICNSQQETLAHLLTCREARNLCSEKTVQVIQSLTENKYEADLDFLVKELLRGPPVREVC